MLFIVNVLLSKDALDKLLHYGEVVLFSSSGILEDYLSGHADLFFTRVNDKLVYAPNTPEKIIQIVESKGVELFRGTLPVGWDYPDCAVYNIATVEKLIIHKFDISDKSILELTKLYKPVNVRQGMTRCSTLVLDEDSVITSDKGIEKQCISNGIETLYVTPEDVILPGKPYGLFGGCCGIAEKQIFLNGSLSHKIDGEVIKNFVYQRGYEIIELTSTPLTDLGSIICI